MARQGRTRSRSPRLHPAPTSRHLAAEEASAESLRTCCPSWALLQEEGSRVVLQHEQTCRTSLNRESSLSLPRRHHGAPNAQKGRCIWQHVFLSRFLRPSFLPDRCATSVALLATRLLQSCVVRMSTSLTTQSRRAFVTAICVFFARLFSTKKKTPVPHPYHLLLPQGGNISGSQDTRDEACVVREPRSPATVPGSPGRVFDG